MCLCSTHNTQHIRTYMYILKCVHTSVDLYVCVVLLCASDKHMQNEGTDIICCLCVYVHVYVWLLHCASTISYTSFEGYLPNGMSTDILSLYCILIYHCYSFQNSEISSCLLNWPCTTSWYGCSHKSAR